MPSDLINGSFIGNWKNSNNKLVSLFIKNFNFLITTQNFLYFKNEKGKVDIFPEEIKNTLNDYSYYFRLRIYDGNYKSNKAIEIRRILLNIKKNKE